MTTLILLAGGTGARMRAAIAKQHITVGNKEIIEYTLQAFSATDSIAQIVVVSHKDYLQRVESLKIKFPKISAVVQGGDTRMLSVYNGISHIAATSRNDDKVIISDAARPCVTIKEIDCLVEKLNECAAVTSAIECYETIIKCDGEEAKGIIPRESLFRQTSPEGYRFSVLKWLYLDASLSIVKTYKNIGVDQLLAAGQKVGVVRSNPLNFKITTSSDVELFKGVIQNGFDTFIRK